MTTLTKLVGQRLRLARQTAGFKTARAFAHSYEIAQSTYSQYETGKRRFSVDVLAQFSQFLNINPNWLLFGRLPMFYQMEEAMPAPEEKPRKITSRGQ
jgi:transcriptional regulator with XRE-family HTH domain